MELLNDENSDLDFVFPVSRSSGYSPARFVVRIGECCRLIDKLQYNIYDLDKSERLQLLTTSVDF